MTIKEMYGKKAEFEQQLESLTGNSKLIKNARKIVKENIDKVDMMIFKVEAPEQYENYKNALIGYVENTHIF